MRESEIIDRLRGRLGAGRSSPYGIGDDAAILLPEDGRVIALDALCEGVHFDRRWSTPADAAFKAFATNVSDLWAMGAEPRCWLLALGLPPSDTTGDVVDQLVSGFADAAEALGVHAPLVGGDTVRAPALVLSVTMIGAADGTPLLRSGATPGLGLWVDGPLGLAAAGLDALRAGTPQRWPELVAAHRRPLPRRLTAHDAAARGIVAAIDISDGLARDATRLATASGVGIEIFGELPGLDALTDAAEQLAIDPLGWQLHGGDDYVRLVAARDPGQGWTRVGSTLDPALGLTLCRADGSRAPLGDIGFEHFDADPSFGAGDRR